MRSRRNKIDSNSLVTKLCGAGTLIMCTVNDVHGVWVAWLLLIGYCAARLAIHRVGQHITARRTAYRRHLVRKYSAKYAR